MALPADAAYIAARSVLDAIVAAYAADAVALPDRRLVTPGVPAWDCEGVYVQVERMFAHAGDVTVEALSAVTRTAAFALRGVGIGVTIVRCVPVVDGDPEWGDAAPPAAAAEEAAAAVILADVVLAQNAIVAAQRAGDLAGCNALAFESWSSVGPDGGLAGGVLRFRLGLGA